MKTQLSLILLTLFVLLTPLKKLHAKTQENEIELTYRVKYNSETMGKWNVKESNAVQFDGESTEFVKK